MHSDHSYRVIGVIVAVAIGIGLVLSLFQTSLAGASPQQRIGLVMGATIDDLGWGALHYAAMQYYQSRGYEIAISEEVPASEWENAARGYAENGYRYIIMGGPQFTDITKRIAPDYPNTIFLVTAAVPSETPLPSNMIGVDPMNEQSGYLAGVLAGGMTKTNAIGIVAGMDFPNLVRMYEAFKLGAVQQNPAIQIYQAYTGNFIDVTLGYEAAQGQLDAGADIIFQDLDRGAFGVVNALQERGGETYHVGNTADQSHIAPDITLTSALTNHTAIITKVIDDVEAGRLSGGEFLRWGVNMTVTGISPYHNTDGRIPADLKAKIEDVKQQIADGRLIIPEIYTADGYREYITSP
jgi:basic membrane protein A